ncbi:MAG: hypothetical protein K0U37_07250 [Gammaproteobacteria bacterium]|nr:hypothetical protein [Gammaproteobacteria bacterium]
MDDKTEEKTTILYILSLLDLAFTKTEAIFSFAEENKSGLLNLASSKTRDELGHKLEESLNLANTLDLDKINITGASSFDAANALSGLFEILAPLKPFASSEMQNTINQKQTELEGKITTFEEESLTIDTSKEFEKFSDLNQYIENMLEKIASSSKCSIRLEKYQELQALAIESSINLSESLIINSPQKKNRVQKLMGLLKRKEKPDTQKEETAQSNLGESTFVLINGITNKITQEKDQIITQFDESTRVFTQKIDALEKRSKKVNAKHAENTYTPAITTARTFLNALDEAKTEFKKTGDLPTFEQSIQKLFKNFPNRAEFEKNRSNRWFRAFISKPFEILKEVLNKLIGLRYTTPPGDNKHQNQFFAPPKTGTSREFEAYEAGLENLGSDEKKSDPPKAG